MSKLIIDLNSENGEIDEWKKLCLSKYGIGGIKKRFIEVVKSDLEILKSEFKQNLNTPKNSKC